MKKYPIAIMAFILVSCSGSKHYQMSGYEKAQQKGFHANQANEIIDKNAANRQANEKAAEKNRQKINEQHAQANTTKNKNGKTHTGVFKFY